MAKPYDILLLSREPTRVFDWARALTGAELRVWQGVGSLPPDAQLDVVISDCPDLCRSVPSERVRNQLAEGRIGRILVGPRGTADVRLPVDCSDRELRLACRLLAENVAVRRQWERSRRMQQMLDRLANTDPLTGLPNRRAWDDHLLAMVTQAACDVCLAVLDLDHLKSVNDRFGHRAGDAVLQAVAGAVSPAEAGNEFVARLGGDEFGLLRAGADPERLPAELDAWRKRACRSAPYGPVTATLGYAFAPDLREGGLDPLFSAADEALRQAKAAGRDRCLPAGA